MKKQFEVIPIEDYYVVVDKEVSTKELLQNPEWWVYRRDGKVQQHKEDREGFFCDKIIATIGKRIGNLPLIKLWQSLQKKKVIKAVVLEYEDALDCEPVEPVWVLKGDSKTNTITPKEVIYE